MLFFLVVAAIGQTTIFQHRGTVIDSGGAPLNGNFDLLLVLHAEQTAPTQVGNAAAVRDVWIVNGVFTALVDFTTMPFTTQDKLYLEVRYRAAGSSDPYVVAANREPLLPSAFALRAHHATTAAFAQTADSVQGVYAANIVQNNQTGAPQAGVEINVGGGVSGWALNSNSTFNIGWDPVLSSPFDNLFIGRNAGRSNAQDNLGNTFAGTDAGRSNVSGIQNAFFGRSAGASSTASYNSFFGSNAGASTRLGYSNSFFGEMAGLANDSGSENVFVGRYAGLNNRDGSGNTLAGSFAGSNLMNANGNTFFGAYSGRSTSTDSFNTLIGFRSDSRKGVTNSTAIGNLSQVDVSNAVVLGSVAGVNGADRTAKVGIGTTMPQNALEVIDPGSTGLRVQTNKVGGSVASFGGNGGFYVDAPNFVGGRLTIAENGNVGLGTSQPATRLHVKGDVRVENGGIVSNGSVRVDSGDILGLGGNGLVLKNRYGQCFRLEVNQSAQLVIRNIFCP